MARIGHFELAIIGHVFQNLHFLGEGWNRLGECWYRLGEGWYML